MPVKDFSLPDAFGQAVGLYQGRDFGGARRVLKLVLRKQPEHFDALHLMGLIEAQRGHHKDAELLLRHAVRINPRSADAHSNRANVQRELRRYEESVASCDLALAIKPDYANAHNNRAIALAALGRFEEALASYDQVVALQPQLASGAYNRAMTLVQLGRLDAAVADFDKALALDPRFLQSHVDRGNALVGLGRIDDALASYDKAILLEPRFTGAMFNRALALLQAGRSGEALAGFDAVLSIDPAIAGALDGRGNALLALGRLDEALAGFDQALKADPQFIVALNNRGFVLSRLRRFDDALASFNRALKIDPKFPGALNNRGNALVALGRTDEALASFSEAVAISENSADALANRGAAAMSAKRYEIAEQDFERVIGIDREFPYALGNLLYAKLQCCDWNSYDELQGWIHEGVGSSLKTILPFESLASSDSPADQQAAAKTWVDDVLPARDAGVASRRYAHDKIRIAYLSTDFNVHPLAVLMVELFERHDRSRFETVAISFGRNDGSEIRARLEKAFSAFHDVRGKSDSEIASLISGLEIDIAVDLTGFTENCRPGILALRPAPVQVNYLGYLGTMGADFIDYVLADRYVIPELESPHYTEHVVHLPDTFLVTDTTRQIALPPGRAEMGLPDKGFVFCCFNNRHKITPQFFDVWMRLLRETDGSVLWLASGNAISDANLRREAEARGVAPERLVFMAHVRKSEDYLARYLLADLYLDTLPYNAITTAVDALWAGLPMLTCAGQSFAGRGAASLLHAVGMPELIADSLAAYEATAFKLARDAAMLAGLKQRLASERASFPLFDTVRFRRNIEAAYVTMWEGHQRGEPPAGFAVPAAP